AVLAVAAFCGLRNSELRGLQWRDLDLTVGMLRLPRTKNRTARTVPLPAALIAIFDDHRRRTQPPDERAYVFTSPTGRQWLDYTLSRAARRVWDAAGIGVDRDRVKPLHDLRATSASLQLATGADLESVRENLGWKSREIVKHYLAPFVQKQTPGWRRNPVPMLLILRDSIGCERRKVKSYQGFLLRGLRALRVPLLAARCEVETRGPVLQGLYSFTFRAEPGHRHVGAVRHAP
ncbi:MAG: site-specific integrase, partial [Myxococcota bacterium]